MNEIDRTKGASAPRITASTPSRRDAVERLRPADRPGRYRDLKQQVTTLRSQKTERA